MEQSSSCEGSSLRVDGQGLKMEPTEKAGSDRISADSPPIDGESSDSSGGFVHVRHRHVHGLPTSSPHQTRDSDSGSGVMQGSTESEGSFFIYKYHKPNQPSRPDDLGSREGSPASTDSESSDVVRLSGSDGDEGWALAGGSCLHGPERPSPLDRRPSPASSDLLHVSVSSSSSLGHSFHFRHPLDGLLPPDRQHPAMHEAQHRYVYHPEPEEEPAACDADAASAVDDRCESDISGVASDDNDPDLSSVSYNVDDLDVDGEAPRSYRHLPNSDLNLALTSLAVLVLCTVIGIAVGHYLGTGRCVGRRDQQTQRLREIQDDYLRCVHRTEELQARVTSLDVARVASVADVWKEKYSNLVAENAELRLQLRECQKHRHGNVYQSEDTVANECELSKGEPTSDSSSSLYEERTAEAGPPDDGCLDVEKSPIVTQADTVRLQRDNNNKQDDTQNVDSYRGTQHANNDDATQITNNKDVTQNINNNKATQTADGNDVPQSYTNTEYTKNIDAKSREQNTIHKEEVNNNNKAAHHHNIDVAQIINSNTETQAELKPDTSTNSEQVPILAKINTFTQTMEGIVHQNQDPRQSSTERSSRKQKTGGVELNRQKPMYSELSDKRAVDQVTGNEMPEPLDVVGLFQEAKGLSEKDQRRLTRLRCRLSRLTEAEFSEMSREDIDDLYDDLDDIVDDLEDDRVSGPLVDWLACHALWWRSRLFQRRGDETRLVRCLPSLLAWQAATVCRKSRAEACRNHRGLIPPSVAPLAEGCPQTTRYTIIPVSEPDPPRDTQESDHNSTHPTASWLFERAEDRESHHHSGLWAFKRSQGRTFERSKPWYYKMADHRAKRRVDQR